MWFETQTVTTKMRKKQQIETTQERKMGKMLVGCLFSCFCCRYHKFKQEKHNMVSKSFIRSVI